MSRISTVKAILQHLLQSGKSCYARQTSIRNGAFDIVGLDYRTVHVVKRPLQH